MTGDLPEYFFRIRENGAAVFRVSAGGRTGRIGMDQIAVANIRNGEIRAHGQTDLSEADRAAIRAWIEERQRQLAAREIDDILRTVDHLNLTAQWAQSRAADDELDRVTDALLLAMHDLRAVLVRRKADRIGRGENPDQ